MHLDHAQVSHAVGFAGAEHVPPSSEEPPEPPVEPPEPPPVIVLEEPPEPAAPLFVVVVPPSPLSVTSVVHAPRIAITADAAAHLVMFFISSLSSQLATSSPDARAALRPRHAPFTFHRPVFGAASSHVSIERVKLPEGLQAGFSKKLNESATGIRRAAPPLIQAPSVREMRETARR
jgi:hypothetical protein